MKIQVYGGHLATYSAGQGPVVIFIHGGPGDTHHYMRRMAQPLYKDFQCVFFDQRGTGESNDFVRHQNQFVLQFLLEDLVAIHDHYANHPVILVGHSWGASGAHSSGTRSVESFAIAK